MTTRADWEAFTSVTEGPKSRIAEESAEFRRANATLRQRCQDLRASLVSVRQQLRRERARARTVSRTLNPRLPAWDAPRTLPESLTSQSLRVRFLQVELRLCQTFLAIARDAGPSTKRSRNLTNAKLAYAALLKFSRDTKMSNDEKEEIDSGMERAREALDWFADEERKVPA